MVRLQLRLRNFPLPRELLIVVLNRLNSRGLSIAACVSRGWRLAAAIVNSTPRFAVACSRLSKLDDAMDAVLNEVLQDPFWPDFAIVFAGLRFKLEEISAHVKSRLPSRLPLIACHSVGMAGPDAATGERVEKVYPFPNKFNKGLMMIVGRFPGVHVEVLKLNDALSTRKVEKFVAAAGRFSYGRRTPVSPFTILLLGHPKRDAGLLLGALEKAYGSKSTVLGGMAAFVDGMEGECLLAHSGMSTPVEGGSSCLEGERMTRRRSQRLADKEAVRSMEDNCPCDFVALVLTEEIRSSIGGSSRRSNSSSSVGAASPKGVHYLIGGAGWLRAVGPSYTVAGVREGVQGYRGMLTDGVCTQIVCEKEGKIANGNQIVYELYSQLHAHNPNVTFPDNVGIFQKEKRPNLIPSFSLHDFLDSSEKSLFVSGSGIRPRDSLQFYQLDPSAAKKQFCEALTSRTRYITGDRGNTGAEGLTDAHAVHHGRSASALSTAKNRIIGGILFGPLCHLPHQSYESVIFQQVLSEQSTAEMFCSAQFGQTAIIPNTDEQISAIVDKPITNYFSSQFILFYA